MKSAGGLVGRDVQRWHLVRVWPWLIGLLLCSGCAVAQPQHAAAVHGAAGTPAEGGHDVLQHGESYYHYILSYAYQLRDHTDENITLAIAELEQAVAERPDSAYLYTELAQLHMRHGDMSTALQAAQRAVELDEHPQHTFLSPGGRACFSQL